MLLKKKRSDEVDFETDRYAAIDDFQACVFYCQNEVSEVLEKIFGVVDCLVTAYDGEHCFCSCSNCVIEIRKKYSIEKKFADGKHDECLDETEKN